MTAAVEVMPLIVLIDQAIHASESALNAHTIPIDATSAITTFGCNSSNNKLPAGIQGMRAREKSCVM